MDIDRIISKFRNIVEAAPTNNISGGNIGTYDKMLFPPAEDTLDQDYQTPGQSGLAKWRFSNVYPVQKLSLSDIDSMTDASKKYTNVMDDRRLENIRGLIRSLNLKEEAPTNSVGAGGVAGIRPGEDPPVNLKKKRKKGEPTILARGLMPGARKRWSQGM
tara:strand:- start:83 stop:562 length:480 start_codon:yes stop_codon:yes gene_type:complete